jgi:uncharacterized membrane protein
MFRRRFNPFVVARNDMPMAALLLFIWLVPLPIAVAQEAEEVAPHSTMFFLFLGLVFGLIIGVLGTYIYFLRQDFKGAMKTEPKFRLMVNAGETEERLLRIIAGKGGKIKQSELARSAGLSKARASEVLSKLEARGIIYKRPKGRTNVVVLKDEYYKIE